MPAPADEVSGELRQETMIINMGPQHPSTHGVLRLLLELDGEQVIACQPIIGYLHTGIEKNTEYRTWQQGVVYVTRADYLSPFFNELAYCLAVERLLGIEAPSRAQVLRVMFCELNRISSHLVYLATGGLELGAISVMLYGFREREVILDIFEAATGLRMNHAYVRIGGVVMDLPDDGEDKIRSFLEMMPGRIGEYEALLAANPIWVQRNSGVGYLSAEDCLALGVTGPILRAAGVPADLRKDEPYSGYETYDFDVVTREEADAYARFAVRIEEMRQSLRIVAQCLERLREPGPVMVEDPKVAWPAKLPLWVDRNAKLYVGGFAGWLDDFRFGGVHTGDTVTMPEGVKLTGKAAYKIHFLGGRLNPAEHSVAQTIGIEHAGRVTTIEISPNGTMQQVETEVAPVNAKPEDKNVVPDKAKKE
ncbi:MAG: NADH-quinone oxidoreductase subunit D [Actinobacteria bacterium]|nr:NADH-quinone oxidoreductase subunit D [Actinomycetota bacterium]